MTLGRRGGLVLASGLALSYLRGSAYAIT